MSEPTICAKCEHCYFLPSWYGSDIPSTKYSWCIFGLHQVTTTDYVTGEKGTNWNVEPPKCSEKNDKGECPDFGMKPEPPKPPEPKKPAPNEVVYIPEEPKKHWWQR